MRGEGNRTILQARLQVHVEVRDPARSEVGGQVKDENVDKDGDQVYISWW